MSVGSLEGGLKGGVSAIGIALALASPLSWALGTRWAPWIPNA